MKEPTSLLLRVDLEERIDEALKDDKLWFNSFDNLRKIESTEKVNKNKIYDKQEGRISRKFESLNVEQVYLKFDSVILPLKANKITNQLNSQVSHPDTKGICSFFLIKATDFYETSNGLYKLKKDVIEDLKQTAQEKYDSLDENEKKSKLKLLIISDAREFLKNLNGLYSHEPVKYYSPHDNTVKDAIDSINNDSPEFSKTIDYSNQHEYRLVNNNLNKSGKYSVPGLHSFGQMMDIDSFCDSIS